MGLTFEVLVKEVHEEFPEQLKRHEVAEFLASHKADAYKNDTREAVLITADTIVCLDDKVLNKPGDAAHAREMLQQLSGRSHEVITGVCVMTSDKKVVFHDKTTVYFAALS
ncbi:MAG: Maf family protein, partial [Hymenobacteraceae bacterium]|nr:Maf family protein [Hymenobacteraceae bacterium]MDX5396200.1 Maf family protein [Hymenobacteraceae bacterium]MDX5512262.1 Maf family protein [Hymenobacteraceae bacterium]